MKCQKIKIQKKGHTMKDKIIFIYPNLKPEIINFKTVWIPDECECGEFRIIEKNSNWYCVKCGKKIKNR